jgi:malonate transporter MadL subunit
MYIPIVVAMAARQDVVAAVSSGWMAIIAGVAAVAVSFAMIPLLDRVHIAEGHADADTDSDGNDDAA